MARFTTIPAARILSTESTDGLNQAGEVVRIQLLLTATTHYIQHYVQGIGVSTRHFSGARRSGAPDAYDALCLAELGGNTGEAPVEAEPPAEAEAPAEAPTRVRGANRPDAETAVWAEGDLAVVMVQGRVYRYDLRRGATTLESVPATRNWRAERQALISQAQGLTVSA